MIFRTFAVKNNPFLKFTRAPVSIDGNVACLHVPLVQCPPHDLQAPASGEA
jgi:hypothetical protein